MPGILFTLLAGKTVPLPVPPFVTEALESVEVTHSDADRSGFQMTFQVGRGGPIDFLDYPLLSTPVFAPFNRVVMIVTIGIMPRVLMDGIVTHQELAPSNEPGASRLTVTGEDVSVMMDLEEKTQEHPAQDETIIAAKIILTYAQYGLLPLVIPPFVIDPPIPIERTPVQRGTDRQYLTEMAQRYSYAFYIAPGPIPLTNTAYWGPPKRLDLPQRALSVNLGSDTNVDSISFRNNALGPLMVTGKIQDRQTDASMPVRTFVSTRPPLSPMPAWLVNQPNVRSVQFSTDGLNIMQAFARAQAMTDASVDSVTADGELDGVRYGDVLQARSVVGVRGAGFNYDGFFYVKSVSHSIKKNEYKQRFSLSREGVGSLSPAVVR